MSKTDRNRQFFKKMNELGQHNQVLLEALDAGSDFRIAFRKSGEKEWTRVLVNDGEDGEAYLRDLAIGEVEERQNRIFGKIVDVAFRGCIN